MQSLSATLTPPNDGFHRIDRAIAESNPVSRQKLLYADVFTDRSCLLVYLLSGPNPARLRRIVDEHPAVITGRLLAYEHCHTLYAYVEPGQPLTGILTAFQRQALLHERPWFFRDGRLTVTLGGTEPAFERALDALPDRVSVDIECIGTYDPEADSALSLLTERQQEVLEMAVRSGYYDTSLRTSPAELGAALDCSPETAADRLREAERTVLSALCI